MSKLWCFFGVHEYKIHDSWNYVKTYADSPARKEGNYYHLKCEVCGKIKIQILV